MTDLSFWAQSLYIQAAALGVGATLFMDAVALLRHRFWAIPSLDYALVGRWSLGLVRGQLIHHPIQASVSLRGETSVGWTLHYLIGIGFAALWLWVLGAEWIALPAAPLFGAAMMMGAVTVLAPYLILHPAFGFGLAARHTPNPALVRWRSFVAHLSFGLGLFVVAQIWRMIPPPM
ncbi:DUF2938 family protein [Celeribacter naphthalenivorans]|uniref:DUF2938 family protein n=1 Tax=Celeribacter naphthalenivorans TaxID=1614694 RepID=UPI001CFA9C51|nr:DUF2938 family protein [Celeribacter naphthalenivorans]